MGIPRFFRWLSERYPLIIQRHASPPDPERMAEHFPEQFASQHLEQNELNELNEHKARNEHKELTNNVTKELEKLNTILEHCSMQPDFLSTCSMAPPIDRLYVDVNGLLHGCAHNNNISNNKTPREDDTEPDDVVLNGLTEDEIFRNVCYYLDRIVNDIVKPTELVYLAIDGVAPRAKLNQQRARRYRSSKEAEIEKTVYDAHMYEMQLQQAELEQEMQRDQSETEDLPMEVDLLQPKESLSSSPTPFAIREIHPGRFAGKFEAYMDDSSNINDNSAHQEFLQSDDDKNEDGTFHLNSITPGTVFFQRCTEHIEHFIQRKVSEVSSSTDKPNVWNRVTVIFSGPNVPGEGEHKILQFMREQQHSQTNNTTTESSNAYHPNLRHCIAGQDGDLIVLGLATHEPNLVLLREKVHFVNWRKPTDDLTDKQKIDLYIHNPNFEFLHINVLRDYLAYEFETTDVVSTKSSLRRCNDLEHCIDDFVFLTFFVGNDFLPHMPSLEIADDAFDLLFYIYREQRQQWINDYLTRKNQNVSTNSTSSNAIDDSLPYLTHAGSILSGKRLESFLSAVGSYETHYYNYKKSKVIRENDKTAALVELGRNRFRQIVSTKTTSTSISDGDISSENTYHQPSTTSQFQPVLSSASWVSSPLHEHSQENSLQHPTNKIVIRPENRLGNLLQYSSDFLSTNIDTTDSVALQDDVQDTYPLLQIDDEDLKGRYYSDKFNFSPFDEEKHIALRKAYIEGLVWNLKYYYEGCVSWDWYYPYHYGPMLSDLVNIDQILKDISFENKLGKPLLPFEMLMACMPQSKASLLPQPYRHLMTDPYSPIADFYPRSFIIDMNGKRYSWEAVILLPFIDSHRLLEAIRQSVNEQDLTDDEKKRNQLSSPVVYAYNPNTRRILKRLQSLGPMFQSMQSCSTDCFPIESTQFHYKEVKTTSSTKKTKLESNKPKFLPKLQSGVQNPLPGFSTLRDGQVVSVFKTHVQLNVHGSTSRYKTFLLELRDGLPDVIPVETIANELIGSIIYINYPHFIEAFVTAVSDSAVVYRGQPLLQNNSSTQAGVQSPQTTISLHKRFWQSDEAINRSRRKDFLVKRYVVGEEITGTGGLSLVGGFNAMRKSDVLLSVRPFAGFKRLPSSTNDTTMITKCYSPIEVDVPLFVTSWTPLKPDPRLENVPIFLEKDPFNVSQRQPNDMILPRNSFQMMRDIKPNESNKAKSSFESSNVSKPKISKSTKYKPKILKSTKSKPKISKTISSTTIKRTKGKNVLQSQSTASFSSFSNQNSNLSSRRYLNVSIHQMSPFQTSQVQKWNTSLLFPNPHACYDSVQLYQQHIRLPLLNTSGFSLSVRNTCHPKAHSHPQICSRRSSYVKKESLNLIASGTNFFFNRLGLSQNHRLRSLLQLTSHSTSHATTSISLHMRPLALAPRRKTVAYGMLAFLSFFMIGVKSVSFPGQEERSLPSLLPSASYCSSTQEPDAQSLRITTSGEGLTHSYTHSTGSWTTKPDFFHGTTTVAFIYKDGIIAAVDSRASLGSFVGSKTTQKVLPINSHILGTMAGGAADCSYWIRKLRCEAALHELVSSGSGNQMTNRMSVVRASQLLSNALYYNKDLGLSIGTMIMGFDIIDSDGGLYCTSIPKIFYVDSSGARVEGDVFAVGSGSTYAFGILDTARQQQQNKSFLDLRQDEAVALGIRAIRHATFRDASSGGFVNVYLITPRGWKLVFSEDLDQST